MVNGHILLRLFATELPRMRPSLPRLLSSIISMRRGTTLGAHRVVLARALLGLEAALPVSFAAPVRTDEDWVFEPKTKYCDAIFRHRALH